MKLGRVVDLQTDELRLSVRKFLGLVEVVGVVVDRAEGYPVEQDDKLAPLDVENAVSRRFDHPILQPVPLLLAYLLPELILGVVGQVGLLEDLTVRPQHSSMAHRIPDLDEAQIVPLVGDFKHSQLRNEASTTE